MEAQKRTWAEISLDNISYNFRQMKSKLEPGTRFMGVVKANAYGHGAIRVASLLSELGADYLAVACLDEAVQLRNANITLPVLILGYTAPEYTETLIENDITQAVSSLDMGTDISDRAVAVGKKVRVHIKVDSGMGRMGFTCHDGRSSDGDILKTISCPGLDVEGIFTHFAVSDILDDPYTSAQFTDFTGIVGRLEAESGKPIKIRHCTNSGAMINYGWTYMDLVRPGIALYGCYPDVDKGEIDLKPAMALKTRVVQIKDICPHDSVSYGRTYKAGEMRRVAVIPIGYADGLHRVLSGKIEVLVRGVRVSQIGRICMDMCMIDVTDVPDIALGDVATIFGRDGNEFIPIEEQSEKAGTISYELLCSVSQRVPRIYIKDGAIV